MTKPLVPDDGLRAAVGRNGTNKHYPCGHPRTPENTQSMGAGNAPACRLCRRRVCRESYHRRKARAA